MSYVALLFEAEIKDRDVLAEVMADLSNQAQADEPGTVMYEWNVSDDGSTLFNYERYADSDAALAHVAGFGPHAERFLTALSPIRVLIFGTPSDALKEALAGFGPSFTSQIGGFHR